MDDILHYSNLGNIILTGDFHAPTGTLLDYVLHDNSLDKNYCQTPDNYIHDQADARNNIECITNEIIYLIGGSGVRLHDGPDLKLFILVGLDRSFRLLLGPLGLN